MKRPERFGVMFFEPRDRGLPESSWWADAKQECFDAQCQDEFKRMRHSREHRRQGDSMILAYVDGKQSQ